MNFLVGFFIVGVMFVYFYLLTRWMKRGKGGKRPQVIESAQVKIKATSQHFVELSFDAFQSQVRAWMEKSGYVRVETTPIEAHSIQESYQKEDPIFGVQFLVYYYHCQESRREVPVELLLQFRDCVRLMNFSKGFAITNGSFPSDTEKLFEEAPVMFLTLSDLK